MAEKKIWLEKEITCKPLDSFYDILAFLQDPPPWRTLCVNITPHSKVAIKNIDINPNFGHTILETPQTFCHYDSERKDVRQQKNNLPKTLVCHDMANGYHDDAIIDGTGNYDSYSFYNWAGIDIFCYFSHHLITIPPLGWINVGHAHGVKVIGTIITEWSDGVAFWDHVLNTKGEAENFANTVVTIAKTLKFDGWLLNIENKISNPTALLEFVQYLHTRLHQELDDPVLIWYDSVTIEGRLTWQNELNEKNKAFFDAVDGFFTNYSWTERNVEYSAAMAGDRLTDLFIGIDIWGRNFYGGGQFNTQEAIQVAYEYGCSLAIFAPAWTHEAIQDDDKTDVNYNELNKYEYFLLRDRALWGSIWPYLNTSLPCTLPFKTSFCRGQGKKRRLYGEVLSPRPWYNLRHMQYQPNSSHGPHGFLLSTHDNIKSLADCGALKDKNEMTKYRQTLEESKMELFTKKSKDDAEMDLQSDFDADKSPLTGSVVSKPEDEMVQTNESGKQPHDSSTKLKKYFRFLFKTTSPKNEERTESEARDESSNALAATSSSPMTGQSMVQMSVKFQVGHMGKTRYALAYVANELECLEPFFEDSFTGGSCLKVNPSDEVSSAHRLARLFHCDFHCDSSLIVCVVTKTLLGHEDQFLNVKMSVTDRNGAGVDVVLVGHNIPHTMHAGLTSSNIMNIYPSGSPSDPEFRDLQRYLLLNEPGFYTPVENSFGWKVRYYEVKMSGARVTSINCRTGHPQGPILLGYIGLCKRNEDKIY